MNYKEYLYQNYSDKLITDAVKKAQRDGNVDPHKKTRNIVTTALAGLSGITTGMGVQNIIEQNNAKNASEAWKQAMDKNIAGGILGGLAGIGLGVGLSKLQNKFNRTSIKRLFKNAVSAGLITEKELKDYLNTGKITPSIAKAMNSTTVGDNLSDLPLRIR